MTERRVDHLHPHPAYVRHHLGISASIREGDTLVVHSLDRLGRSLDDLRKVVTDLNSRGVVVQFLKENLTFAGDDSDTSLSKLMFNMLGSFAEFERSLIARRVYYGAVLGAKKEIPAKRVRKTRRVEKNFSLCGEVFEKEARCQITKIRPRRRRDGGWQPIHNTRRR